MSIFDKVMIGILAAVEVYYWFWWVPRNWRTNRECRDIVHGLKWMAKHGVGL